MYEVWSDDTFIRMISADEVVVYVENGYTVVMY